MICPSCKTLNFRDTKFCRECGQKLAVPSTPPALDATRLSLGNPEDVQVPALLHQAFTAFEAGQTTDARLACQSALALRPDSTAAHSLLGLIYEKEGKTAEAIHQFQIVLELNPNSHADREKLDRLLNRRDARSPAAWFRRVPVPLAAGGAAAAIVLVGGLWLTSLAMRPRTTPAPRVRPTNLRIAQGAPGAVAPAAGSMRLPPPPSLRAGASAWGAGGFPSQSVRPPGSAVGGIPPTVQMNGRMAAIAPSLFSSSAAPVRPRPIVPRQRYLPPAPVRIAGGSPLSALPRPAPPSSVPQLPDARPAAAPEVTSGPETPAGTAPTAATPVTPPVSPPAETPSDGANDAGGESYIRIRPLAGSDGNQAAAPSRPEPSRANAGPAPSSTSAPAGNGPSLAEARLHQQNGFSFWRQGDYASAYQEYEYAEQLYRLIAARGGADSAAALQGMRAAQQGMQASRGRR
jgi:Tetratricopeptide repeat